MRITGVTITGADDHIAPDWLAAVAADYPFVEFAILISQKRQGKEPRYPSNEWIRALLDRPRLPRLAAHLCGQSARDVADGIPWGLTPAFDRVQLNGVGPTYQLADDIIPKHAEVGFIIQANTLRDLDYADSFASAGEWPNVSILYDPSGGRGHSIMPHLERHPRLLPVTRRTPTGYAGGIGPDNCVQVCERLRAMEMALTTATGLRIDCSERNVWIDMESGVRTEDRLDPHKVVAVLKALAPLVQAA